MMANSIGIIDPGYIGSIMIALTKVDESAPDIQLPMRCAQDTSSLRSNQFRRHIKYNSAWRG
jgi:dUTPase